MSDVQTGFILLAIGFPVVFLILLLVIALGKGLILVVNKYVPEGIPVAIARKTGQPVNQAIISQAKLSSIISAIQVVTNGKGKVSKVEKL